MSNTAAQKTTDVIVMRARLAKAAKLYAEVVARSQDIGVLLSDPAWSDVLDLNSVRRDLEQLAHVNESSGATWEIVKSMLTGKDS